METMEATRVTIDEVKARMDRGEQFTFVDARNPAAWAEAETKLPGALRIPADEVEQHLSEISHERTVITYCTCPHEASSAEVAQKLAARGFRNVHPLFIGFEAWEKAGLPLEPK
jgi:rhodanese-related sulfurtransferase